MQYEFIDFYSVEAQLKVLPFLISFFTGGNVTIDIVKFNTKNTFENTSKVINAMKNTLKILSKFKSDVMNNLGIDVSVKINGSYKTIMWQIDALEKVCLDKDLSVLNHTLH